MSSDIQKPDPEKLEQIVLQRGWTKAELLLPAKEEASAKGGTFLEHSVALGVLSDEQALEVLSLATGLPAVPAVSLGLRIERH